MVDPGRIRALLDRLVEETANLRRLAALSNAELLADPDRMAAVKYRLLVAIETCIDVGEHIVSSEGLRAPESFADTFAVVAEAGYLPIDAVETLQDMARFRNLLVHVYEEVDDHRVVQILHTRLDDLDGFRSEIARRVVDEEG